MKKESFLWKIEKVKSFWLQPIFNSRPKCSHVIWLPTHIISFSIHFWEPVQTILEKVTVSKRHSKRERERDGTSSTTSHWDFKQGLPGRTGWARQGRGWVVILFIFLGLKLKFLEEEKKNWFMYSVILFS